MQRVMVVCVGRLKERFYIDAAAEYAKRLGRYCRLEIVELPEQRLPENPSQGEIGRALAREAEAIRAKLPPGAALTAMCVEGPLLSMSPMTFPHHLARVMLLEQLYRGFQINEGGKYHK